MALRLLVAHVRRRLPGHLRKLATAGREAAGHFVRILGGDEVVVEVAPEDTNRATSLVRLRTQALR